MALFTAEHLTFRYPEAVRPALYDLSFQVEQGEFVTVAGLSGCGKSTLLRQFKTCLTPFGAQSGTLLYNGQPLSEVPLLEQAAAVGFVQQFPDHQSVTDKVWHELAFGLESLGLPQDVIRRRTAETASFFGMESWYERSVDALSGGQKQLLQIASVMAMQPSVLLLDEPTAQLDPIAAQELFGWLQKLHRESGVTIILSEHHLEEVCAYSDRMLVLSGGRLLWDDTPQHLGGMLYRRQHPMFLSLPSPTRLFEQLPHPPEESPPLSVAQGRHRLAAYCQAHPPTVTDEPSAPPPKAAPYWEGRELWFRYEKESPDVLKGCSLSLYPGEFLTILGGNGTGKTTLLSLIAGCRQPYRGTVRREGKKLSPRDGAFVGTALLPQDPLTLFVCSSVQEELDEMLRDVPLSAQERQARLREVIDLCELDGLLTQHPYDLSGGERQRAALAKVLLTRPKLLLLDEPTKGLDGAYQYRLAAILRRLTQQGTAVAAVSHDIAFCAAHADRCALLFNGTIVSEGTPKAFFASNSLYTTAVRRMTRGLLPCAVTTADVLSAFGVPCQEERFAEILRDDPPDDPPDVPPAGTDDLSRPADSRNRRHRPSFFLSLLSWGGRGLLLTVTVLSLLCCMQVLKLPLLSASPAVSFGTLIVSLLLWLRLSARHSRPLPVASRPPDRRTEAVTALILLVVVPLTVWAGFYLLEDTKYLFLSLLVLTECMVPFFLLFEKRRVPTRELVLMAVLCALTAGSRTLLYMLPSCKPVTALVIIAGTALGGESGFLVGASAMLVSNFFFGQGLWTPWQMMAMGFVGALAGWLFHHQRLVPTRVSLAVCGLAAALAVYGGIMNPVTLLLSRTPFTPGALLTVYAAGWPTDCVHAVTTALFLYYGAEPILSRIARVRQKYGLMR